MSTYRRELLTPEEVATLFRVSIRTVARWGAAGQLGAVRTPTGRLRFKESAVREVLREFLGEWRR